ncbi:small subunit of replication factor C [Ordospora colligata]|uniref:Small subunit of replication factor C n=1 Tax=Ordospora colligata OC4 TaxID=1354746 RepID=A0A0B2UGP7_9MICR|nr:small subunit of replication factor C [Ordospora colligata OC4]KHN70226.1 small subunit of replication factor C [Ordospora colligata OC4]TBU16770.1 small subunit of replication factor C [Ordospora colligata]TBU17076.1 small subunit of replication factor C [Ordospora colligata]TBU19319.1 small subunit of replication factor C [Ordospora colligata]
MQQLTEKYRPRSLQEIVGNREVVEALSAISSAGIIPHMLFYGPPGTGKTTAIRSIASKLPKASVLELNASDERGISTVRETIKEFASAYSKSVKLVILDEADMMSRDAQNALRRIIEDFSASTRFCLIANYSKKIILPIISRCTKFRFGPVNQMQQRIKEICMNEDIRYTEEGVDEIARLSAGDMRKAVNDIQGVYSSFGVVDEKNVQQFNGTAPKSVYLKILNDLVTMSATGGREMLNSVVFEYRLDCNDLVSNLCDIVSRSNLRNKMKILKNLSDVEYRASIGCSEDLQLNAIIGTFILNRD